MKDQLFKVNQFLLFWILLTIVLFYGKVILIPVAFAAMLAMLMAPVCRRLDNARLPRALSATVCILILLGVIILVFWIMGAQVSGFRRDLPVIEQKTDSLIISIQHSIEKRFDIPVEQQTEIMEKRTKKFTESAGARISAMLGNITGMLAGLAITLVVTFLLLYHKERYETFFLRVTKGKNDEEKKTLFNNITKVAQNYLTGRAISMFILFVLYAIALLAIGIKNALLLAAVAALVNIIPYIGPLLAGVFPFIVALVTEETFQPAIWVIITFTIIQGIDNYFVTPVVLGGEVSLSALSTILSIVCGGFVWGVAGMILFIPMLSIAKIIFDHVDGLKPYGYLIGDPGGSSIEKVKEWFSKKLGGNVPVVKKRR